MTTATFRESFVNNLAVVGAIVVTVLIAVAQIALLLL